MSPRSSAHLLVLIFLSLLAVISACSCPDIPIRKIYNDASVIVRARIVRVSSRQDPRFNAEEIRYKLHTLHVFKGCSPGKFFRARTVLDGGICSSVWKKGAVIRVILPAQQENTYDFFGCYDTRAWEGIPKSERRFLWRLRKNNECMA